MADQWIVWCGTNAEQDAMAKALGSDCVSVDGRTPLADKNRMIDEFLRGEKRVMVTKPSVLGWGMNLQNCCRMIFVGLSDSYESYYQCIRRCWRFGQTREVVAYIVLSEAEQEIHANVLRKEAEAERMGRELIAAVAGYEQEEMRGIRAHDEYRARKPMELPVWM